MLLNQTDGYVIRNTYDSLQELADHAAQFVDERNGGYGGGMDGDWIASSGYYRERTPRQSFNLATTGWDLYLDETIQLARSAVETIETETEIVTFTPVWDTAGSVVDVGMYLAGESECMIEYPPAKTTRTGRVVTLCASISYSAVVSQKSMVARGKVVTAFALELSRLGLGIELWADVTATNDHRIVVNRVLVKGPNDILDPSKVLFAYAHPDLLRGIVLSSYHGMDEPWRDLIYNGYGYPTDPIENLPEGTIYLPSTLSRRDLTDIELVSQLRDLLDQVGLTS